MSRVFVFLFITLIPFSCFAVVINEIAWMGTQTSYNDEWIELFNPTNEDISLDGWKLTSTDGSPDISLQNIIPSKGFFLLERTDDESVPNIQADMIYTGSLSNKGEHLKLIDSQNNVMDEVINQDAWIAGDNTTKQTMEKVGLSWLTSKNPGGTPKQPNQQEQVIEIETII